MRVYDYRETIVAKLADSHAAMLVRRPLTDTPEIFLRQYVERWSPFKKLRAPPKHERAKHRTNAREDFHMKCAVLLTTMHFDGRDGRPKKSASGAEKIWLDLRAEHPGTLKDRGSDTIHDIWKHRNRDHSQPPGQPHRDGPCWDASGKSWADAPSFTRADVLTLLSGIILADEERFAARAAKAHAAINGGQK